MLSWIYQALDIFFFIFHTLLVLFNTLGWTVKKLRIYNLITLLLTTMSWFLLGIWYGWGYCFCTDWHWKVRGKLGYKDDTHSYLDLLFTKLTGIDLSEALVDTIAISGLVFSLLMSITLNIRDSKRIKPSK